MLIDTHCHLDDEAFADDLPSVVESCTNSGIVKMLTPGTTRRSSEACIALADRFPTVFAGVAVHPECLLGEIQSLGSQAVAEADFFRFFEPLTQREKVVAVGETGLDLYWKETPLEIQTAFLRLHFELARRAKLPIILHCRDAESELLEFVHEDFSRNTPIPGVIHSFSGGPDFLKACLDLGFYISYSGSVTFTNKKFRALRETVPLVPSDRILVETDSPDLAPMPLRGRVPRNEPSYVLHTATQLAQLLQMDMETFSEQTTANAERLFGF